jgi:hypothetical protein
MMSLTAFEINSNVFDQNKRKTQTKLWCEIDFNVVLVFLSKSDCMVSGSDLYVFSHCSAKKNFNFNCLHCNSIAINMNVYWLAYCAID